MALTRVAISRPVFMSMVILALVLLGAISYRSLSAELFPSISSPVVTVVTLYTGAAPEDVERLVTKPIEDAVAGLSNIDYIQSTSSEGQSVVIVVFTDKANENLVTVDVERRVSAARGQIPTDANVPVVSKFDFTASPVFYAAVSGPQSQEEIYNAVDNIIRPRLEAVDGVAQVSLIGGLAQEVQVRVDPNRLAAYNLNYDAVSAALSRENQSRPGGSINAGNRQLNVRLSGLFQTTDDIGKIVVANPGGGPVYLRDVADVVIATKKVTQFARFDGQNAVSLTVTKSATANEIYTVDNIKAEITDLQKSLPEGMTISTVLDRSEFTRNSLNGVQKSLLEAIIITGLVLLVFLHTFRSTVIVLFAIPTSLLTTFLWMSILGFTLNVMSTLALVLVIGVLVDDSIVVIENIARHLELGETPWQAALNGRSEIGLAAIAITLVDVVIFTPVGFLSGTTGGFFKQFGLVIVAAVLTSLFISFTLTPMLASRWLNSGSLRIPGGPWGWFIKGWEWGFTELEHLYEHVLRWLLTAKINLRLPVIGPLVRGIFAARWIPPIAAVVSLVAAFGLVAVGLVKFEFIPQSDDSFMQVDTELPPGSTLAATDDLLRKIEDQISQVPEVENYLTLGGASIGGSSNLGVRGGAVVVTLKPTHERTRSVFAIIEDLKPKLQGLDGAIVNVGTGSGPTGSASPISVRVQGQNRADVEKVAAQVEQVVRDTPGTQTVKNSSAVGTPEFKLQVNRNRLADFRITADQVASALRTTVDGTVVTKFRPENGDELDVRLISTAAARDSVNSVADVPITVIRDGQPIQVKLGQVTSVEEVAGPASISRRNRVPQASVTANLQGTTPLNDVTVPLETKLVQLRQSLPEGVTVEQAGEAAQQAESFSQLLAALGLSIILIYMLLAALYESLILPFATMFALPVATVGAFIGLAVTGLTFNLLSLIGMIVLMGLVAKNGILLVDYTNTLRARGRSRLEALLEAGPTRLRPILMTSAALVFGLLPIAIGAEEGSALYRSIGALIIGGMLTSTLLSLIVVPAMYTFFDDIQSGIGRFIGWRPFRRRSRTLTEERVAGTPALEREQAPSYRLETNPAEGE